MLWAAVKGLLGHPGALGIDAAERFAAVVAGSFPRAELEDLLGQDMNEELVKTNAVEGIAEATGSDKARLLLEALKQHCSSLFNRVEGLAAAERVLPIEADPQATLTRVQGHLVGILRCLYYQ